MLLKADCDYWKDIVAKLRTATDTNWAAHVLATDSENIAEARQCLSDAEIIQAVISAYGVDDWLTHSYCDKILFQFEREAVRQVYGRMITTNDDMRRGIERFLTL